MATDRVASGEIYIGVNDAEAIAALRKIDKEFDRTMADIDRQDATISIDGDLAPLEDAVLQARRRLKKLEGQRATAKLSADKRNLDKAIKGARTSLKRLEGEKATVEIKVKSDERQLKAAEARIKAIHKAERAREAALRRFAAAEAKRERESEQRVNRLNRSREALNRQRERELTLAERQAYQMQRERNEVPKLEYAYAKLQDRLEKLQEVKRKARGDERATFMIRTEEADVVRQLAELRDEVRRRVGRDPIEVPFRLTMSRRAGVALRNEFQRINAGGGGGGMMQFAAGVGLGLGAAMGRHMKIGLMRTMERGVVNTLRDAGTSFGSAVVGSGLRGLRRLGHTLQGLSEMTVRLGPFTATIRQAITMLALFSPIILDVVGALGSLVSVVGSATLGLGALSVGLIGGALPAFLGIGIVIKQVAGEFADVVKAQKAYDDALQKGNTDLAKKKMKELKSVMGNVSKETITMVGRWDDVQKAFRAGTGPARASLWTIVAEGISTADTLMDTFTKRTNESMKVLEVSTSRWMKALRSPEGESILDNMMGNFAKFLSPALDGLGNILAYLGRVGSLASNLLPGMGQDFENWSEKVLDSSDDMKALQDRVNNAVESLRSLGRFLMAGGRLMKAFFGGGVASGQSFLDTMSQAMGRWTTFLNTAEGNKKLTQFFEEAVRGTQALYSTLAPMISTFVRWAAAMAPVSRGFFQVTGAVADFIAEILRLTGLSGTITALATTLGVLWGIGKVSAATRAISQFTMALLGMNRAAAASATTAAVGNTVAGLTSAAAMRAAGARQYAVPIGPVTAAGKAAAGAGKAGRAATMAAGAMRGLGLAALGIASPLAGAAVLAGAAGFAIYTLSKRSNDAAAAQKSAEEATSAHNVALQSLPSAMNELSSASLNYEQAQQSVNDLEKQAAALRKAGKRGTDEYKQTVLSLRQARLGERQALLMRNQAAETELDINKKMVQSALDAAKARRKQLDELREDDFLVENFEAIQKQADKTGVSIRKFIDSLPDDGPYGKMKDDLLEYADALDAADRANQRLENAQIQSTLAFFNQKRAMQGLVPIATRAARVFANLQRLGGKNLAQTVSVKFEDPTQATRAARSAAGALRSGVPRQVVTRIVADSSTAEEAVRRLNRIKLNDKNMRVVVEGGKEAAKLIERIAGIKLTTKQQRIAEKGGNAALALLERLINKQVPGKTVEIRAIDRASATINALRRMTLPPKYQHIFEVLHKAGGSGTQRRGSLPQNAAGAAHEANERRAAANMMQRATGSITRRPTFMAGEATGHSREYVISTHPKWRKRNRGLVASAARDLGAESLPQFAAGGSTFGSYDETTGAFNPKAVLTPSRKFKPKKKLKQKLKSRRGWASYIDGLHEQQGIWEREVSIREGAVREPEDYMIVVGKTTVTDPVSGEKTDVEQYGPNPAMGTFRQDLANVMTAMNTLMSIVMELVRAIPQAIMANKSEFDARSNAINTLDKDIKKQRKRVSKASKDDKPKEQNRLDKLINARDAHAEENKILAEDRSRLTDERQTAGLDVRDYGNQRTDLQERIDSVSETNQAAQIAGENERLISEAQQSITGGSSGGGGAEQTMGIAEQTALTLQQNAETLREFGSNFIGNPALSQFAAGALGGAGSPAIGGSGASIDTSGFLGGGAGGGAAATAAILATGGAAAAAMSGASAPTVVEGDKTIILNNTFEQYEEPHTFVKGVEYEVGSVI